MKVLIIDTTLKHSYVAAFNENEEAFVYFDQSLSTQSAIIPACEKLLAGLSIKKNELDGVVANVGPGSFTGIRIGVTFANAIAFALKIPRFALTSFDIMRALCPKASAYFLDAGHNSVYAGIKKEGTIEQKNLEREEIPDGAVDQETILDDLPHGALLAARKVCEEYSYSSCMSTAEVSYLKPNYMRRSQAERMKEEKNNGRC